MSAAERPPLSAGLDPLVDAEAMRATDAWAIGTLGMGGGALMEAAGAALADAVVELVPEGLVVLVCGGGNNGGDGYVAARLLAAQGRPVRLVSTVDDGRLRGDAAAARDAFGPGVPWGPGALDGAAVIVDAVLGTGARDAPRGVAAEAIAAITRAAAGDPGAPATATTPRAAETPGPAVPVVACDVPSGVDATTGETPGDHAVTATTTVSFHAAAPGHWIAPGKSRTGRLVVAPIGIPSRPDDTVPAPWGGVLTPRLVDALPTRGADGTKFRSGHVVVLGGSPGMSGAPCLAARGAMRGGAGYVTVAAPASIEAGILARAPVEALGLVLPDDDEGGVTAAAADPVLDALAGHGGTLVVGPGLGRGGERGTLVRDLVARVAGPVVFDADALAAVAGDPEALAGSDPDRPTVLTPHAGELARLLDVATPDVTARRLHHAREAARRAHAVVVLKGDDTLVVAPDGRVAISPGGVPGLATAGTGDVLAGLVGALLARGTDPFLAAAAGVWLHLRAGALASAEHGPDGVVARDVADRLGQARRDATGHGRQDPTR
ncbi:NAD(P)H-hydrate dehydratase [Patulibacter sp. NPDC049589]|uniref:NAD(P)H-hydrate dehydratase n=1 Tax=Patulibacter sp. NPDC049589 TaxID=3154731 RepID=UPI0034265EAA